MYVHIGNNVIIDSNNIIGIFNIEALKKNDIYEKIKNELIGEENIIDISNNKQKTLILIEEETVKAYISNISSVTIGKRIN